MNKINVEFCAGSGAYNNAVNYMRAVATVDGEDIELYAEIELPDCDECDCSSFDEEHYPLLKNAIIDQAVQYGIDPDILIFWWD